MWKLQQYEIRMYHIYSSFVSTTKVTLNNILNHGYCHYAVVCSYQKESVASTETGKNEFLLWSGSHHSS